MYSDRSRLRRPSFLAVQAVAGTVCWPHTEYLRARKAVGRNYPKPDIVVPVVRVVPVAVGAPHVVVVVVERATAQRPSRPYNTGGPTNTGIKSPDVALLFFAIHPITVLAPLPGDRHVVLPRTDPPPVVD